MRPRTEIIPKPLVPIDGRPLLWYAIRAAHATAGRPVVVLDYKADLIRGFFEDADVDFAEFPGRSMIQALLDVSEQHIADAYLCMSCDVLMPPAVVRETVEHAQAANASAAGFTVLPAEGHKRWQYTVEGNVLTDLRVDLAKTRHERVALVVRHDDLHKALRGLPRPISTATNPERLRPFNDGWTLLLRALLDAGIHVRATQAEVPLCNVNVAEDLPAAAEFARRHLAGS
jgi:GTP:adenosylcobinamide-phosphate guanylyltransferase